MWGTAKIVDTLLLKNVLGFLGLGCWTLGFGISVPNILRYRALGYQFQGTRRPRTAIFCCRIFVDFLENLEVLKETEKQKPLSLSSIFSMSADKKPIHVAWDVGKSDN